MKDTMTLKIICLKIKIKKTSLKCDVTKDTINIYNFMYTDKKDIEELNLLNGSEIRG